MDLLVNLQNVLQTSPYVQAWLFYLAGALGCIVVFWRITRSVWPFLQLFLRAVVAILLLMPIRLQPNIDYWVPTSMFVAMKTITKDFAGAAPGVRQLLIVTVALVLAAWAVYALMHWYKRVNENEDKS